MKARNGILIGQYDIRICLNTQCKNWAKLPVQGPKTCFKRSTRWHAHCNTTIIRATMTESLCQFTATACTKVHMLQWQPVTGARPKKAKKARAPPPEDRAFGCRAGSAGTLERFIQMSVPASEHGVDELKTIASQLGLKTVRGGRDDKYDRWGFGLTGPVSKFLANAGIKVPATLFKWKRSKTKAEMYGTLLPVNNIRENVKMWMDAREKYARLLSDTEGGSGVKWGH